MKFIKDLLHKNEHMFMKGGKLEKLYPLYEAQESFLFTPRAVTESKVHVRDALDSKRMMSMVIVALLPCILFGWYNVGYQEAIAAGKNPADVGLFALGLSGLIATLPIILSVTPSVDCGKACSRLFAATKSMRAFSLPGFCSRSRFHQPSPSGRLPSASVSGL